MEKTKKGIEINLNGRKFIQDSPTFEQEMYIMEQSDAAGLLSIEGGLKLDDKQNLEAAAKQMILTVYRSGSLFRLMASMLTEEGTSWTRESADSNAEFFKTIKSPESKKQLQAVLVGAVLAFFESAAGSDLTSLISSDEEESPSGIKVLPRSGTQAAAAFFSGNTRSPSKKSVTTTKSPSKRSSLGKLGKVSSPLN